MGCKITHSKCTRKLRTSWNAPLSARIKEKLDHNCRWHKSGTSNVRYHSQLSSKGKPTFCPHLPLGVRIPLQSWWWLQASGNGAQGPQHSTYTKSSTPPAQQSVATEASRHASLREGLTGLFVRQEHPSRQTKCRRTYRRRRRSTPSKPSSPVRS